MTQVDGRDTEVSHLTRVVPIEQPGWEASAPGGASLVDALERGDVLLFPRLRFDIEAAELGVFSPAIAGRWKNVSYDRRTGRLGGTSLGADEAEVLRRLLDRFSQRVRHWLERLLVPYAARLETARTSFRPVEIAGRATSWRKDDTRLHVDAFPATPVQDRRILRVFSNVNPEGRARVWRVGGEFASIAERFAPRLRLPWPGAGELYRLLRLTKSRRSAYDALMLQLHDAMKADAEFQARSPQTTCALAAGTTWVAFTDQVAHAAMAGQYQLEQTFLVPVDAMVDERRAPLRVLERLTKRRLA